MHLSGVADSHSSHGQTPEEERPRREGHSIQSAPSARRRRRFRARDAALEARPCRGRQRHADRSRPGGCSLSESPARSHSRLLQERAKSLAASRVACRPDALAGNSRSHRLRRLPGDPLPARHEPDARPAKAPAGAAVSPRQLHARRRAHQYRQRWAGARGDLQHQPVRHSCQPSGAATARRCRLRGLPHHGAGSRNRLARVHGRFLFPHLRSLQSVRPVGPRPRHRHRPADAGGVPALHRILARDRTGARTRRSFFTRCSTGRASPAPIA